jgi:hypothetical protein
LYFVEKEVIHGIVAASVVKMYDVLASGYEINLSLPEYNVILTKQDIILAEPVIEKYRQIR